jgi:hypothetical protein
MESGDDDHRLYMEEKREESFRTGASSLNREIFPSG